MTDLTELPMMLPQVITGVYTYAKVRPDGTHQGVHIRLSADRAIHIELPVRLTRRFLDTHDLLKLLYENVLGGVLCSVEYDSVTQAVALEVASSEVDLADPIRVSYAGPVTSVEVVNLE